MQAKPSIVMFKAEKDLSDLNNPSIEEILSNTCGSWKVDKNRISNIKYAAAVIKNVIVALFEVTKWGEVGDRYRFIGKQASPEIACLFVGQNVSEYYNGSQNPVKYLDGVFSNQVEKADEEENSSDEYELKLNVPGRWEVSIQKFASPQKRQEFVDDGSRDNCTIVKIKNILFGIKTMYFQILIKMMTVNYVYVMGK